MRTALQKTPSPARLRGTSAAWLYDLLKPHVTKVIVCDPRKNALLNAGSKNFSNAVLSEIAPHRINELLGVGHDVILQLRVPDQCARWILRLRI
jgi:hypothetical protein